MLNSGKKNRTSRDKILTLVLSEKKILNETKNHNPLPFKLNGRSLMKVHFQKLFYCKNIPPFNSNIWCFKYATQFSMLQFWLELGSNSMYLILRQFYMACFISNRWTHGNTEILVFKFNSHSSLHKAKKAIPIFFKTN